MTAGWLPKISKFLPLLRGRRKSDRASAAFRILIGKKVRPSFSPRKRRAGEKEGRTFSPQSGQATVEYVLLLSLIGAMALGFTVGFNRLIQDGITRFNAVLERELSPGSWNVRAGVEKRQQWKMTDDG